MTGNKKLVRSFIGNIVWYYHRQKWIVNAILEKLVDITQDSDLAPVFNKPIFMIGFQGAGETLLSRIIRRSPKVLAVSGGPKYWFGPDEMHTVLGPVLHARFTGQLHKVPRRDLYGRRRGWAYASRELLPYYKLDESDVNVQMEKNFIFALRVINRFRDGLENRIFDKSKSYALKIPAIRKILSRSKPKFVAVLRDPFTLVYRAACIKTHLHLEKMPLGQRVEIAASHWNNTVHRIRKAQETYRDDIFVVKIEDCLSTWPDLIPRIFAHIELEFDESFLPSENDHIPWWAKRADRWFPVRREINNKYKAETPYWISKRVEKICGENATWANYMS